MKRTDDPNATRSTLIRQLKDWSEHGQWDCFYQTYGPVVYRCAIGSGLTHEEAQDVVQETTKSALKSLPGFEYDREKGSFRGWLMQLARWRIQDQLRKRDLHLACHLGKADSSTRTATVERQPDRATSEFEARCDREWETEALDRAAKRVRQKVNPKHYQIFDLLFFKNWTVPRVANFMNISPARVYLTKHRVANLMKKEVALLRDTLL